MDRETLNDLFDYTTFTWESCRRIVARLPEDALTRPVEGSGWPALRNVLFHIAGGWDGWLRNRAGASDPLEEQPADMRTWADVQAVRDRTRGWMRRVLDETSDAELARVQHTNPDDPASMLATPAEVIAHLLLHERGHHGDVTTLLSALGANPPQMDYLVYVYFKRRAGLTP